MLSFGWGTKTRKQSLPEGLVEESVKGSAAEMQALIDAEWKKGKRNAAGMFLVSVFVLIWAINARSEPILDLDEMLVTEGELVAVDETRGVRGRFPTLTIRKDDGTYFSAASYAKGMKQAAGKQVKVWSEETCLVFGLICHQIVNQIQYRNRPPLAREPFLYDYVNFVRKNMESVMQGRKGYLIFTFPVFFLLFAIGLLDVARYKVKRIRKSFEGKLGE